MQRRPDLKEAYTRGRERYKANKESSPEPKQKAVEVIQEPQKEAYPPVALTMPKSQIVMEVEEPVRDVTPKLAGNTKQVAIGKDGRLAIGFEGNIFTMKKRDRDFLNQLIDLTQEYESEVDA